MGISRRGFLATAAVLAGCARAPEPSPDTLAITDVRVFDGHRVTDADTVLVSHGRITAVGRGLAAPEGATVHRGRGGTLLPGLIDAHVHVYGNRRRDAARFGVTSLVDMFCDVRLLPGFRKDRDDLGVTQRADVWSAGNLVTVPGGHGTEYAIKPPTVRTGTDLDAFVADRLAEGSDFIKLILEEGTPKRPLPTLSAEQVTGLTAAAHRRGAKVAVHVHSVRSAGIAVAAGADFLAHAPDDAPLPDTLIARMKAAGTAVITTLAVTAAIDCAGGTARTLRADPRIDRWLGAWQRDELDQHVTGCAQGALDHATANVAALHRAGVPVLAGTDAANPGTTGGASLHAELALLTAAGLRPVEALTAATSRPAALFGIPERGTIRRGDRADLLLVRGDPTTDVTASRDVDAIWKNGELVRRKP